ncbi:hypothetical protein NEHOM01_1223 [Nematocida homosporus]|uniref:uncharacterized protein n=1 Tax=Nematocida homosporus TaxID=1912981 RepID=UPI00221EEEF1|nr:uncharacterized protein NEHOM01_1223 [Nematocida homosporus]KAI5186020.1 hypothetical protein NEHOM01_1223 [Nematocida homosporus]
MDTITAQAIRERLAKLSQEVAGLAKEASVLEHSIAISRRKNAHLAKDVQELRRRREEQATALNKEENRIFALARELSENEDKVNQMEVELEELNKTKTILETEIKTRGESVKEYELILGLYEGCATYW